MKASNDIQDLLAIMARLRTPGSGCPWDLEQDFRSIAPYAIEEAHEVADAIEREDFADLKDELGDLLLQVAFHSRMAQERGLFAFGDVVAGICDKLIRRHPHVFGDAEAKDPEAVERTWSAIKAQEKATRAAERGDAAAVFLDGVPTNLPALTRAIKLQDRAAKVGFDWNDPRKVLDKIREETDEVERELDRGDRSAIASEIGDLFFAVANLARHLRVDPEQATRSSNRKFMTRFAYIERELGARGRSLDAASLDEMEALWREAKERS